jgi:hypothetical protein
MVESLESIIEEDINVKLFLEDLMQNIDKRKGTA